MHLHDRVGVEVLGNDLAAVAEDDLAPGGGTECVDEAALDLGADQVGVDGDAAVEREGDLLEVDLVAAVEGDLGDLRAVAVEEAAAGDAAGAALGYRGSPPAPLGHQLQRAQGARVVGQQVAAQVHRVAAGGYGQLVDR